MQNLSKFQQKYIDLNLGGDKYDATKHHTNMFNSYDSKTRIGNRLIFNQQNLNVSVDLELKIHLKKHGWDIQDYIVGLVERKIIDRDGNSKLEIRKIGKVLQQTGGDKINHSRPRDRLIKGCDGKPLIGEDGSLKSELVSQSLLEFYNTDHIRDANKDKYDIIISRDKYDIVSMSSNKSWTSCMRIPCGESDEGGLNHIVLKTDLTKSTLVAYSVKRGCDNINDATGRVTIKRYVTKLFGIIPHYIYRPERKTYGNVPSSFFNQINDLMCLHYPAKDGKMYFLDEGLYSDGRDTIMPIKIGIKFDFSFNVKNYNKQGQLNDYIGIDGKIKPAKRNLITGTFHHYINGKSHTNDDSPSSFDGERYYHLKHDILHRDGDKPSIYDIKNKRESYYYSGVLHTD